MGGSWILRLSGRRRYTWQRVKRAYCDACARQCLWRGRANLAGKKKQNNGEQRRIFSRSWPSKAAFAKTLFEIVKSSHGPSPRSGYAMKYDNCERNSASLRMGLPHVRERPFDRCHMLFY